MSFEDKVLLITTDQNKMFVECVKLVFDIIFTDQNYIFYCLEYFPFYG